MISSLDIKSLRNGEYIQLMKEVLGITDLNDATALQVQVQRDALGAKVTLLDNLYVLDQGSPFTVQLQAADKRRDNAINGITAVANGYLYHFDATTKAHAAALVHNLDLYGPGIGIQNQNAETATLNSIIADWTNQPELAAAITALSLGAWKTELAAANTAFNTLYLQRTQEMGAAPDTSIEKERPGCNEAYYTLCNFIDSNFILKSGIDPWGKTTSELNALIAQYNTLLAQRAADAAAKAAKKKAAEAKKAA